QKRVIDQNGRSPSSTENSKIRCGMTALMLLVSIFIMSYPPFNEGYITANYLNNYLVFRFEFILFAGSKAHATARGLQPPACCCFPAMWWMAKRLHRVISARVVAKWSILVERGAG
ncbi:hypothetical protein ACK355_16820, partial [Aeromonas veronii]